MSVENIVEQGKKSYGSKKYKEAAGLFAQAAEAYEVEGNPLLAAEMKNNQSVAYLQDGNAESSLEVVTGTDVVFASAGDLKRQGMALANKASALVALKRKKEAIACYEESAQLLEQAGEKDMRADVMRSIAALQVGQGKLTDAVISMQSGLIEVEKPTKRQKFLKKILFRRLWR